MKLFGLDIGTTAIKSVLINEKLEELHSSNTEYEIESHGAFIECDAQKYWELVKGEIDALGIEPDALAVDTQCETLILTDGDGNPVRKAIVWLDNRAADEAEKIREHFGNKKVYEVTGQCEMGQGQRTRGLGAHQEDIFAGGLYPVQTHRQIRNRDDSAVVHDIF